MDIGDFHRNPSRSSNCELLHLVTCEKTLMGQFRSSKAGYTLSLAIRLPPRRNVRVPLFDGMMPRTGSAPVRRVAIRSIPAKCACIARHVHIVNHADSSKPPPPLSWLKRHEQTELYLCPFSRLGMFFQPSCCFTIIMVTTKINRLAIPQCCLS